MTEEVGSTLALTEHKTTIFHSGIRTRGKQVCKDKGLPHLCHTLYLPNWMLFFFLSPNSENEEL
jgi:hypothetical protein